MEERKKNKKNPDNNKQKPDKQVKELLQARNSQSPHYDYSWNAIITRRSMQSRFNDTG